MKSLTTKILAGIFVLLILATVGNQVYFRLHEKRDTTEAVLCDINEDVTFQGVVVRDESVVTYKGDGVLDYLYKDGSKVSVNNPIAEVYSSVESIAANKKAGEIRQQIEDLKRAQNPGTTNYVQPETLKSKIDNEYKQLLTSSQNCDYSSVKKVKNDMSIVMNIYNVITGTSKNYNSAISALEQKAEQLESQANHIDTIDADETGYFVSYCDGYENELTTDSVDKLTASQVQKIIDGDEEGVKPSKDCVGKIFSDYSCKIVGIVDADKRIVEGATLPIMFNTSNNIYNVTVDSVKNVDDDKYLVVFSCDRLDDVIVKSRVQTIEVIFGEHQGIKVPRQAIRFKDKQKGVYVVLGNEVVFKKIDVIYEGDDYVVSKNTSDDDYLLLYDQILLEVLSNKNVSDSKNSE